jgi:hypothetical protein
VWGRFQDIFETDRSHIEEALRLCHKGTEEQVMRYIQLIILNLWGAGTLNARPKAIKEMTASEARTLYGTGQVHLRSFKTALKYKVQAVMASADACSMMRLYDERMRHACVEARHRNHPDQDKETFPFFVSPRGGVLDNISKILTSNLGIGTIRIRSMIETEAYIAMSEGKISNQQFRAIQELQGHSQQTSFRHYVKVQV